MKGPWGRDLSIAEKHSLQKDWNLPEHGGLVHERRKTPTANRDSEKELTLFIHGFDRFDMI